MNPRQAGRLATEAAGFYRVLSEFTDSQAHTIDFAFTHALHDFLPEGAVTAVFEHGGKGLPLVLGATEDRLHAFDLPRPPEENEPVADVRWRSFLLNPEKCDVQAEVGYSRPSVSFGDEVNRRTHWHFRIHDLTFDLPTRVHAESEDVEPREQLARHLASCLGAMPPLRADAGGLREAA